MVEGQFPSLLCIEDPVSKGKLLLIFLHFNELVVLQVFFFHSRSVLIRSVRNFIVIDIGKSSFGIMRVKEAFEYAYNVLESALRNKHYFKINPYRYDECQLGKDACMSRNFTFSLINCLF